MSLKNKSMIELVELLSKKEDTIKKSKKKARAKDELKTRVKRLKDDLDYIISESSDEDAQSTADEAIQRIT